MMNLQVCLSQEEWDDYILEHDGHPLQLWGWGATKALHGWQSHRLFGFNSDGQVTGAAQVLVKKLPWPFRSLTYVPRGPVVNDENTEALLEALENYVKSKYRSVAIIVEPDWLDLPKLPKGWRGSNNRILIPNTLIIDLKNTEKQLLDVMNKKTRQYIRKSQAEESVEIRQVRGREELEKCLEVYRETAQRANFALHENAYYFDVFENLGEASPVFAVYKEGWPIAFLWLAISQTTAFELYGGMNDEGQQLRANYALKWHAIHKMKEWGIDRYDMNGLVSDGVSNFKRGFSDHEDKLVGTFVKPLSPFYRLWTTVYPLGKKLFKMIRR